MFWDNDSNKALKYLLLDFMIKVTHDFRDKQPFEISFKDGREYIDKFIEDEKDKLF